MGSQIALGVALILLVACAVTDVRKRVIPHLLLAGLAAAAVGSWLLAGRGLATIGWKEALLVLAVGFILYMCKCMGAGDVKMLAVIALWFPGNLLPLAFWVSVCGGILGIGYAIERRRTGRPMDLPYALAITSGSLVCFFTVGI